MKTLEDVRARRANGDTFCPYAFVHYHLDTDKSSKLCCHSPINIRNETLDFNHSTFKKIRSQMLAGEKLRHCVNCYQSEADGTESARQRSFEDIETSGQMDYLLQQIENHKNNQPVTPGWYDLRISNNCNLACQMCSHLYSSTWAQDIGLDNQHLGFEPNINMNSQAYKIQLVGGEPFMIRKFAKMLQQVKNPNCEIVVNTNGTIITDPLMQQLKRFNKVHITVSLDGYKELNEKIRRYSKWDTVDKNIKIFIAEGFDVLVNTVVQKDNVNNLLPLGEYLQSLKIQDWLLSRLFHPEPMAWYHQKSIDVDQLKKIINMPMIKRNNNSKSLLQFIINKQQDQS